MDASWCGVVVEGRAQVIDGANVGYYGLRPDLGAGLSYHQAGSPRPSPLDWREAGCLCVGGRGAGERS